MLIKEQKEDTKTFDPRRKMWVQNTKKKYICHNNEPEKNLPLKIPFLASLGN
uniref:Uncharacterized protein n=1 Tax=Nelumbo nucifera TaxID=4432 RepID=A0A822Y165_NELNU|nr:TPA_asm: hypothetical protein HUJ06_024851 [Nelumbo nucifera]